MPTTRGSARAPADRVLPLVAAHRRPARGLFSVSDGSFRGPGRRGLERSRSGRPSPHQEDALAGRSPPRGRLPVSSDPFCGRRPPRRQCHLQGRHPQLPRGVARPSRSTRPVAGPGKPRVHGDRCGRVVRHRGLIRVGWGPRDPLAGTPRGILHRTRSQHHVPSFPMGRLCLRRPRHGKPDRRGACRWPRTE